VRVYVSHALSMPRPARHRFAGAKYHIASRGNGRKTLFYRAGDRDRFIAQMLDCLAKDGVVLYAYCLMPNHFHLFVETPRADVDASMRRLGTAYSVYFRYKHYRPGRCFRGRYRSPLVEGNDYSLRFLRYIHLNGEATDAWSCASGDSEHG
jgi:REP element-mobilizing transposase RayT